jgi:hypothetical protein
MLLSMNLLGMLYYLASCQILISKPLFLAVGTETCDRNIRQIHLCFRRSNPCVAHGSLKILLKQESQILVQSQPFATGRIINELWKHLFALKSQKICDC